jgi:hypothetical protein
VDFIAWIKRVYARISSTTPSFETHTAKILAKQTGDVKTTNFLEGPIQSWQVPDKLNEDKTTQTTIFSTPSVEEGGNPEGWTLGEGIISFPGGSPQVARTPAEIAKVKDEMLRKLAVYRASLKPTK